MNVRMPTGWAVFILLAWGASCAAPLRGQQTAPGDRWDGLVVGRQKYSFTMLTPDGEQAIQIPNGTPISAQIVRPKIDFAARTLQVMIPISAADGDFENNEHVVYDLPESLYLVTRFNHANQMQRVMGSRIKRLPDYELSGDPVAPSFPTSSNLLLAGQLLPGQGENYQLKVGEQSFEVDLGPGGRLSGFSILDLLPFETDAFATVQEEAGRWFAQEVQFQRVGDPVRREDPGLPRLLFIGDTISFNYQRPLREALAGKVNLHHPPTNCAGSENWTQIHRWMGAYAQPGRKWDVISFNFGHWDTETDQQTYQQNLRLAIRQLQKSGARLIWVTSTPVDYGYHGDGPEGKSVPADQRAGLRREATGLVGKVPGRMRLQNEWAAGVMADHPEILICDLWQLVKDGQGEQYADWWFNKKTTFDYQQSVPLARALAGTVMLALGHSQQEINPPSVHSTGEPSTGDR